MVTSLEELSGTDSLKVQKNSGQVIQVARGDLVKRLELRALAHGELFVHCTSDQSLKETIKDLVTNSDLPLISKGDIFMGANSTTEVYRIGGGGSLKWGGILTSNVEGWEATKKEIAKTPDTIYLWNGDTKEKIDYTTDSKGETDVNKATLTGTKSEKTLNLNPGDLVFYSSAVKQYVILPMNRAVWDTTVVGKEGVDSKWLTGVFKGLARKGESVSLTEYINNVANHYQYLFKDEGWRDITAQGTLQAKCGETALLTEDVINSLKKIKKALEEFSKGTLDTENTYFKNLDANENLFYEAFKENSKDAKITLTWNLEKEDPEGAIYYTPHIPLFSELEVTKCEGLTGTTLLLTGDLVVTVTTGKLDSTTGKILDTHKIIPLGSNIAKEIQGEENGPIDIKRADAYAELLNETKDAEFSNINQGNLRAYIEYLFKTKVDIDPSTQKIVTSQLPDFLLGALKYMGTANRAPLDTWNAKTYANALGDSTSNKYQWDNIDSNSKNGQADTTSNDDSGSTDSSDTKTQTGCYWVWNGGLTKVSNSNGIFSYSDYYSKGYTNSSGDYITSKDSHYETPEGSEDDSEVSNSSEDVSSKWEFLDSTSSSSEKTNPTVTLKNGDWLVWNGKEFDIISSSSDFVGLQIEYQNNLIQGIVRLIHSDRQGSPWDFTQGKTGNYKNVVETQWSNENGGLKVKAPNTVISVMGDAKYFLPYIAPGTGFAQATLFNIGEKSDYLKKGNYSVNWLCKDSRTFSENLVLVDRTGTGSYQANFSIVDDKSLGLKVSYDKKTYVEGVQKSTIDWFDASEGSYAWEEGYSEAVELYMPHNSGTIATQEWTVLGFEATKLLIRDSFNALNEKVTGGNEDWLQTIVRDENSNKYIYDSKVKQTSESGKLQLELYDTFKVHEGEDKGRTKLSILTAIKNISGSNTDYELGSETLNPSTSGDTPPENILPNHPGVLLNNNSVIDGGYWA